MEEIEFGTGAIPDSVDTRDFILEIAGTPDVDWSQEFRLPEPPNADQRSSDACVSYAWSYYKWQLKGKTYSKRDLFCRIALSYGAEIRAGGVELVKNGIADNKEVKDPTSPTASNMRDKSGTKQEYRDDDKELECRVLPNQTLDGIAWGIKQYKGVVFGVVGSNEGWKDKLNPRPPMPGEQTWGHALYAFGYHMHGNAKCIIAKSSWKATNEHHIKQDYFYMLNMTFNAWFLVPKENNMFPLKKVKVVIDNKPSWGVAVITPNMINISLAEDEAEWRSYSQTNPGYGILSVNPDGKTNWDVDSVINI